MLRNAIRRTVVLSVVGVAMTGSLSALVPDQALPPTPLETVRAQPGARTVWSRFIGRLDGGSASAIVSAIAVASEAEASGVVRGVRIELRHEGPRPDCNRKYVEWSVMCAREDAAVYVEEARLEAFRADVLAGRAEVYPGHPMGVTDFRGSATGGGILISGYELYDVTLENLATVLAEASAQLKTAPR